MGNGLNEENEGDNGQGNTHRPDQTLLKWKPIPHPAVDLTRRPLEQPATVLGKRSYVPILEAPR